MNTTDKQKARRQARQRRYFRKQRALGIMLITTAILSAVVSQGDITAAIILLPAGAYTICAKQMCITDKYFYRHNGRGAK